MSKDVALELDGVEVTVTNPDKVFFSRLGKTKLDLVNYYLSVADAALRGVAGRPMNLKRFPNGAGGCQSNLETADPLSISPRSAFPVMIEGFTYHPQNQALLQWFQRKTPSDAIDGAFSFPDETLLTSPAQPCK